MSGFLRQGLLKIEKLFRKNSYAAFDLKRHQVFAVYDNGFREYPSKSTAQLCQENSDLLNRIWLKSDFTYEEQQHIISPFISHFIALCGALPASENSHDLYSGGLVRHSLTVCANALHLLERSRYSKDECRAYDAAIVYASLAHDLAKIFTDCEVRGEDGFLYQPFETDFETFRQQHAQKLFYVSFHPQRSTQHKFCHTQNSTLLLKNSHDITGLMKSCMNTEEVLNGSHDIWHLIRQADTRALYAAQSLGAYSVDVFSYIKASLLSSITSGKYSCNTEDSQLFFIPQGLLVRRDCTVYDELHATHFALTHGFELGPGYDEADRFSISLRASGMVALCSAHSAFSWHRLLIEEKLMYVEGLVLLVPKPEGIPCCDWYPRGREPFEIKDLVQRLELDEGRPAVSLTLKHAYDFIRKFDMEDLDTDRTVYGKTPQERIVLARKNSILKRKVKVKNDKEAQHNAYEAAKPQELITDRDQNMAEKTEDEDSNEVLKEMTMNNLQVIGFENVQEEKENQTALLPRRGRGRPKGSRNKKTLEKLTEVQNISSDLKK